MRRNSVWVGLLACVGFLAVACSSSGGKSTSEGGGVALKSSTSTVTPASGVQPVIVNVDAGDYSFDSSLTSFKVGVPYRFVVTNTGKVTHEMMIVRPIAAGTMRMEAMDKMAMAHVEEADLHRGARATLDVTFDQPAPPGTLELACHVGRHYEKGMRLPIVVESA